MATVSPGSVPVPTRSRTCTAADIARSLGVSRAAVSYALNGRPGISDTLRHRILEEAAKNGVEAKPAAAGLSDVMLGLILADVGNPFYSELAVSSSDAARARGCEIIMYHTADEPEAFISSVKMMLSHGVAGIMTTVVSADGMEASRILRSSGVPCVQVSRRVKGFPGAFVGMNDYLAGREIVQHLLRHGYRSIGIACGPASSSSSAMRERGMREALKAAGIRSRADWMINTRLSIDGGEMLARHLLSLTELPRAVACGTDAIAMGLMDGLMREGLRVPDDVAVTGYDGLPISRSELVGLTSIIQPRGRMAALAVDLLLSSEPITQVSLTCSHRLSIGHTCGCLPAANHGKESTS